MAETRMQSGANAAVLIALSNTNTNNWEGGGAALGRLKRWQQEGRSESEKQDSRRATFPLAYRISKSALEWCLYGRVRSTAAVLSHSVGTYLRALSVPVSTIQGRMGGATRRSCCDDYVCDVLLRAKNMDEEAGADGEHGYKNRSDRTSRKPHHRALSLEVDCCRRCRCGLWVSPSEGIKIIISLFQNPLATFQKFRVYFCPSAVLGKNVFMVEQVARGCVELRKWCGRVSR